MQNLAANKRKIPPLPGKPGKSEDAQGPSHAEAAWASRISPVGSRSAEASLTPAKRLKFSKTSADDKPSARPGAMARISRQPRT
jgi:hypothetical protein